MGVNLFDTLSVAIEQGKIKEDSFIYKYVF